MARAKATDGLSEAGRNVMTRGFVAGWTAAAIALAVQEATGEVVKERTVSRRMAEWEESRDRFERAREQYRAMKEAGIDGAQMIEAKAFERMMDEADPFGGCDPIAFHALGLDAKKVALKEREIAVRERVAAISEQKMALLESREKRAIAVLSGEKGEKITAEERLERAKEIYGLTN
jgi:hypothetical protein